MYSARRTHLLPLQRVQPPHGSRVQLDGLRDVGEHLVEGVRRLLVEQNPDGLARFDAAADHGDELGFDEVLGLALHQLHEGGQGARGARFAAHRPVGVHVLGVVHTPEGFVGGAHVTLTWRRTDS